jgi:hypothetical protein
LKNTDEFRYWRTVNLEKEPFNLPKPLRILIENGTEGYLGETYADKSLGLWLLRDI